MKNLNKVLAMVLVVVMAMSSVVFADFTDVTDETTYAEAINVGAALGLFTGYPDGTFLPEGDITRAEFAAIVVRALNQEAQASSAANAPSDFIDVTADHWAKGYINIVSKLGIVNGYGDGNFGPEDLILYEDAIKMFVVALGYEPSIGAAGYPVGYLTKASEIGLTVGVKGTNGVAANRGIVAQLTVNALDIPLMKQTGYGTWVDYEVQDGTYYGGLYRTLLSENLGLVKLVVNVDETSLTSTTATHAREFIKGEIVNNFKTRFAKENGGDDETINEDVISKIYVGDTAASTLVGTRSVIYGAYDELEQEVVAVYAAKDTTKIEEVVIAASDLQNVSVDGGVLVEYWENETDRKATPALVAGDAKVYVNGVKVSTSKASEVVAELWDGSKANFYGVATLQLLDYKDTDHDFDTVFIENIETIVVDENNTARYRIKSKNDVKDVTYDPEDKSTSAVLYDTNGVEMDWADLVEYDVVSIKRNTKGNKTIIEGTKIDSKITGTITAVDDADKITVKYYIDGETYGAYDVDDNISIQNQTTGDFYLDILGNIAYYEETESANTNYAYVVNAGPSTTGLDSKSVLKLFTFDGQYGTFETASKVKVDGVAGLKSIQVTDGTFEKKMSASEIANLKLKQGNAGLDYSKTDYVKVKAVAAGDIITFTTNSSGYITGIDRAVDRADADIDDDRLGSMFSYVNSAGETFEYNEKSGSISSTNVGKFYITDKTVIMVAEKKGTAATEDDFMLFSTANLADEQIFNKARVFNVDKDKNVGLVVVEAAVDVETTGTILAVVTGIGSGYNDEGEDIWNIKVVQDGLVKDGSANPFLTTADDSFEPAQYATFIPKYNAAGELTNRSAILATVGATEVSFDATEIANETKTAAGQTTVRYYYGEVSEIDRKTVVLSNGTEIDVDNKTIVYVYDDGLKSNRKVLIDAVDYVDYDDKTGEFFVETGANAKPCSKVQILAREYDDDITEVVLYIFR